MAKITITYREDARGGSPLQTPFTSDHSITTVNGAKRLFCHYTGWKAKDLAKMTEQDKERFRVQGVASFYTKDGGYSAGHLTIQDYHRKY